MPASYGAGVDNLLDEVLFVTCMAAAMAAAGPRRRCACPGRPALSGTIVRIQALACPALMIESSALPGCNRPGATRAAGARGRSSARPHHTLLSNT